MAKDEAKHDLPRKRRRHTPRQLSERPLTLDSCLGPIVITADAQNGMPVIFISHPADVPVKQPPRKY